MKQLNSDEIKAIISKESQMMSKEEMFKTLTKEINDFHIWVKGRFPAAVIYNDGMITDASIPEDEWNAYGLNIKKRDCLGQALTSEYLIKYKIIKIEFDAILRVVSFLNREIPIEKMGIDSIRNREDSYNCIKEWNNRVLELQKYCIENKVLHLPSVDQYIVKIAQ